MGEIEKGEAEKSETHLPHFSTPWLVVRIARARPGPVDIVFSVTVLHPGKHSFLANGGDQCLSSGFHNNSQELISHSLESGTSKIKMLANVVSGENSSGLAGGYLLSMCSHGFSLLHSHRVRWRVGEMGASRGRGGLWCLFL